MERLREIKKELANSSGFTLIEVLMAVSIISVAIGVVGSGIFQVVAVQKSWADDALATKDLRNAGSWFAGDALNAADALDGPGGTRLTEDCTDPPANTASAVTLTWRTHQITYSAAAGALIREDEFGNQTAIITSGVVDNSLKFTLCTAGGKNLLTLDLEVEADNGQTEAVQLRTHLRKLK